jgi:CheY-like chemotaxis protein
MITLNPEDKIVVYQDMYNKNLVLKIQQQEKVVDNWVLIRGNKEKSKKHNRINGDNNKKIAVVADACNNSNSSYCNKEYATRHSIPILLVDDEEDLLMTFDLFLRSEGYDNIKAFSSSKSLLRYLLESKRMMQYKLVIMDIRMPDINGMQLYQIIRILNPSIKTMFLTALDAVEELTSIYPEIKPTDILRKPIDNNQFIEAVNDKVSGLEITT